MRVVATKRQPVEYPYVDCLYRPEELNILLAESDFVVVIVPLTPETKNIIGEKELQIMKNTAVLINIARGGVVNEEALVNALRKGEIAGAGLDAFDQEPLSEDNPLWGMENVIITPHMSAISPVYMIRAMHVFCQNLDRFIKDEDLFYEADRLLGISK